MAIRTKWACTMMLLAAVGCGGGSSTKGGGRVSAEGADGSIACMSQATIWESQDGSPYDVTVEYWGDCIAYLVAQGGPQQGEPTREAKDGAKVTATVPGVRGLTLHCRQTGDKAGRCYYRLVDLAPTGKVVDPDTKRDKVITLRCDTSDVVIPQKGCRITVKLKKMSACEGVVMPTNLGDPKIVLDDLKFVTVAWNDTVSVFCRGMGSHSCEFDVRVRCVKP